MENPKIWILVGLLWLLWGLRRARKNSVSSSKTKRWKLLRDKPIDLKEVIYHPKEWRKPK